MFGKATPATLLLIGVALVGLWFLIQTQATASGGRGLPPLPTL